MRGVPCNPVSLDLPAGLDARRSPGAVRRRGRRSETSVPAIEGIASNKGASGQTFSVMIHGKHLKEVREVQFAPPLGIEVFNLPEVTEDA